MRDSKRRGRGDGLVGNARDKRRLGGRPPMSSDDPRIQTAKKLHADKGMAVADICKTLQISRPTLYRWLAVRSAIAND